MHFSERLYVKSKRLDISLMTAIMCFAADENVAIAHGKNGTS